MSIRIINQNTGKTIIIKNQDDINNLDTSVSSIDDNPQDFKLVRSDDGDPSNPYNVVSNFATPDGNSDMLNRIKYKNNGMYNAFYDLNTFDNDKRVHYIKATEYPLDDEIESWFDPNTVDAPINRLKTVDIPDNQTSPPDAGSDFNMDDKDQFQQDNGAINQQGDEGQVQDTDEDNQDFQGLIRTVRGACLVFKRKTQNGTYNELWIYNVGNSLKQETAIRKAIISGTDIDPNTQTSDDGQQKASTWTKGNVQFLNITGLVQ
jgi:hypothetical protein